MTATQKRHSRRLGTLCRCRDGVRANGNEESRTSFGGTRVQEGDDRDAPSAGEDAAATNVSSRKIGMTLLLSIATVDDVAAIGSNQMAQRFSC